MTKSEIIEKWAKNREVEKIVRKISKGSTEPMYKDLSQIIWMFLLNKPDELIQELQEKGQYRYYMAYMAMTQLKSPRSFHYYEQRKFVEKDTEPIEHLDWSYTPEQEGVNLKEIIKQLTPEEQQLLEDYATLPLLKDISHKWKWDRRKVNKKLDETFKKVRLISSI